MKAAGERCRVTYARGPSGWNVGLLWDPPRGMELLTPAAARELAGFVEAVAASEPGTPKLAALLRRAAGVADALNGNRRQPANDNNGLSRRRADA